MLHSKYICYQCSPVCQYYLPQMWCVDGMYIHQCISLKCTWVCGVWLRQDHQDVFKWMFTDVWISVYVVHTFHVDQVGGKHRVTEEGAYLPWKIWSCSKCPHHQKLEVLSSDGRWPLFYLTWTLAKTASKELWLKHLGIPWLGREKLTTVRQSLNIDCANIVFSPLE